MKPTHIHMPTGRECEVINWNFDNSIALVDVSGNACIVEVPAKELRHLVPPKFKMDDHVRKTNGSAWSGYVVGTYSTKLTPEGYCVESDVHDGAVQIYPATALEKHP